MKTATILLASVFLVGSWASPAAAHHSATEYDFRTPVEIEGIVQSIRVVNPHTRIFLEVTDAKGTRVIEFEGHSRNNFYRAGWRPETVRAGEKLRLIVAPRRNGGDGGYISAFVTADGEKVGFSSAQDQAGRSTP